MNRYNEVCPVIVFARDDFLHASASTQDSYAGRAFLGLVSNAGIIFQILYTYENHDNCQVPSKHNSEPDHKKLWSSHLKHFEEVSSFADSA